MLPILSNALSLNRAICQLFSSLKGTSEIILYDALARHQHVLKSAKVFIGSNYLLIVFAYSGTFNHLSIFPFLATVQSVSFFIRFNVISHSPSLHLNYICC